MSYDGNYHSHHKPAYNKVVSRNSNNSYDRGNDCLGQILHNAGEVTKDTLEVFGSLINSIGDVGEWLSFLSSDKQSVSSEYGSYDQWYQGLSEDNCTKFLDFCTDNNLKAQNKGGGHIKIVHTKGKNKDKEITPNQYLKLAMAVENGKEFCYFGFDSY